MRYLALALILSSALLLAEEPIDVVYTWVNGSDPQWQAARAACSLGYQERMASCDANSANRYRDRHELKYSLRSIVRFAPFVRHIYIVTAGQTPRWLKPHPRITLVSHREIFRTASDLPTFNSQAIEANLHRIPGLAERFIYFNDDVMLGRRVTPEDFFCGDAMRLFYSWRLSDAGPLVPGEKSYVSAMKNTNLLLDATYGPAPRRMLKHAPFALRRSVMEAAEQRFGEVFAAVSSHQFRLPSDYTLTNGLIQHAAQQAGQAVEGRFRARKVSLGLQRRQNRLQLQRVWRRKYHAFCIEDSTPAIATRLVDRQLHAFLCAYFPKKAEWER